MKQIFKITLLTFFILGCSKSEKEIYEELLNSEDYIFYSEDKTIKAKDFKKRGEFLYHIDVAMEMTKNTTDLKYKVYFDKMNSAMPKGIDKESLARNLYLTNKAMEIMNIESLKKSRFLERNKISAKTQNDLKNYSLEIIRRTKERMDSLTTALAEDYDTVKTNEILKQELRKFERKDTINPIDYLSPKPIKTEIE